MSYRFEYGFRAPCSKAEELPQICRVSCRGKVGKLVHQDGFITEKKATVSWNNAVNPGKSLQKGRCPSSI
jgi:hypothetical protein